MVDIKRTVIADCESSRLRATQSSRDARAAILRPVGEEADVQELIDLEYAWLEAPRTRDMEWLDVTRDSYSIDSFEFSDVDARVYGDTAVVRSYYRQSGKMGGEDRTTAY